MSEPHRTSPLWRSGRAVVVLLPFLAGAALLSVLIGGGQLTVGEVAGAISTLWRNWGDPVESLDPAAVILITLRIPRVVVAGAVGAMMATAGAVFQAALRNPLADPLLLGVAGGSAVGAAFVLAVGIGWASAVYIGAMGGGLVTLLFVLAVSARARHSDPTTMLLAGVIASTFHSALLMLLLSLSPQRGSDKVIAWMLGDFGGADRTTALISMGLCVVLVPIAALAGRTLNLLVLGTELAQSSGLQVARSRGLFYALASALTAASVAAAGIIGFVGLVVPHMAKRLFVADHRVLIPTSALLGAIATILADGVARVAIPWLMVLGHGVGLAVVPTPMELPVGVVTAFGGAPFFIFLLVRSRRAGGAL